MTDLDAIEKRAREAADRAGLASAGPWWPRSDNVGVHSDAINIFVGGFEDDEPFERQDMLFIASARTDVPLLAADVLALVAEVRLARALYEKVDDIVSCSDPFMGPPMKSCGECEHCRVAIAREAYRAFLAKREAP